MAEPQFHTLDDHIEYQLLEARRLYFHGPVDSRRVDDACRKLWYLDQKAPGAPITLIINSPGGSIDAGFAVWDQVQMIGAPVTTVCTGLAASMGSILSLCAARGRRFATPNCRIMIHQPAVHGHLQGHATDLEIHAREILKTRDRIVALYVEATGKDQDTIAKAIDRDTWLTAQEAKAFGLLDGVITSFKDL